MPVLKTSIVVGSTAPETDPSGGEPPSPTEDGQQRFSASLLVRGQSEARRLIDEIAPSHILSIKLPGRSYLGPRDFPTDRQLFVSFDDTDDRGAPNAPDAELIARMLAFARDVPADGKLLIHGLLGVRRSTAVALGLLADRLSPVDAAQALTPLCSQPPDPQPLVVKLFDETLGLDGALISAASTRFVRGRNAITRRSAAS